MENQLNAQKLLEYDRKYYKGAGSGEAEHLILYGIIRMLQPESVLEIGVSRGHMTTWLALACAENKRGKVTSVDNWSRAHGGEATSPSHAKKRLTDNALESHVEFVSSDSVEFLQAQSDKSYDFVWIDGDHSYDGARKDIVEGLRVASKMIAVHDTNQKYDGPRKAIESIMNGDSSGAWVHGGRGIWLKNI